MKRITINNEHIIEDSEYLIIRLRDTYKAAWFTYGWDKGVEGVGLSQELIDRAIEVKKKIMVRYNGTSYTITGFKANSISQNYLSKFVANNETVLRIVPLTSFDRLPEQVVEEPTNVMLGLAQVSSDKWEKLRSILHK